MHGLNVLGTLLLPSLYISEQSWLIFCLKNKIFTGFYSLTTLLSLFPKLPYLASNFKLALENHIISFLRVFLGCVTFETSLHGTTFVAMECSKKIPPISLPFISLMKVICTKTKAVRAFMNFKIKVHNKSH